MPTDNTNLTGIERELVLQYLIDGNVPVTITAISNQKSNHLSDSTEVLPLNSKVFPIALKPEHIKIQTNGRIYLENPPENIKNFETDKVKVEFYFNRVGLYFISELQEDSNGIYIVLPDTLNRIKDVEEKTDYDFSAIIYFECQNKKDINTICIPWPFEKLFTRPVWKSIPLENQKKAKEYLEEFVELAKKEKNAGNGIQLIPICNYITYPIVETMEAVQDRRKPLSILYVDHERIILGSDNLQSYNYQKGTEFGLKLTFSIKNSPILSRDIFVTCVVNNIYKNQENSKICFDFVYTSLQEEDLRYLYEKATSRLFI